MSEHHSIDLTDNENDSGEPFQHLRFQFVDCNVPLKTEQPALKKEMPKLKSVAQNGNTPKINSSSFIANSSGLEIHKPRSEAYIQMLNEIQKENSNIETVFLDSENSSEDESMEYEQEEYLEPLSHSSDNSHIKIHNNIVLTPGVTTANQTLATQAHDVSIMKVSKTQKQKPPILKPSTPILSKKNILTPLASIPPLTPLLKPPNLHPQVNIIQNPSSNPPKTGKKRYFQIPPEIMPLITKSSGPVLLNVPGIGPVLLNETVKKTINDAVEKVASKKLSSNTQSVSDVVDSSVSVTKETEMLDKSNLSDKKFGCWNMTSGKKRDLDGFTATDRLGFFKSEIDRSKKCLKNLNAIVLKLGKALTEEQVDKQQFLLEREKRAALKMGNVRLVKISNITKGFKKKAASKPASKKNKKVSPAVKVSVSSPSHSEEEVDDRFISKEFDNELLLTKKVVVLNGKGQERIVKRPLPQPKKKINDSQRKNELDNEKSKINTEISSELALIYNIKPCFVEVERNEEVEESYKRYHKENVYIHSVVQIFNERILNTMEKFKKEIFLTKPMLIINENNLATVKYKDEFSKYNIIFPMRRNHKFPRYVFKFQDFISGVQASYVKLVDLQVLCKYMLEYDVFNVSGQRKADVSQLSIESNFPKISALDVNVHKPVGMPKLTIVSKLTDFNYPDKTKPSNSSDVPTTVSNDFKDKEKSCVKRSASGDHIGPDAKKTCILIKEEKVET